MKTKRIELLKLNSGLIELCNIKGNVKFAYGILKNKKAIEKELEILEELRKPSEKQDEFEKKRVELCTKHSKKDKNGEPKIKDDAFDIEDKVKFQEELDKLKEKEGFEELEKEQKKKKEEINSLLEEEIEIELHKIKLDDFPDELTANQLEKIDLIIE